MSFLMRGEDKKWQPYSSKKCILTNEKYFIYSVIDVIEFISGIGYIPGKKKGSKYLYDHWSKDIKNNLFTKIPPLFLVIIFNNGGF